MPSGWLIQPAHRVFDFLDGHRRFAALHLCEQFRGDAGEFHGACRLDGLLVHRGGRRGSLLILTRRCRRDAVGVTGSLLTGAEGPTVALGIALTGGRSPLRWLPTLGGLIPPRSWGLSRRRSLRALPHLPHRRGIRRRIGSRWLILSLLVRRGGANRLVPVLWTR